MPRNPGIDLARVLGVLAIVAGHVWPTEPFHTMVYAWHVPLFFFLSGWLWKPRPLRTELAARAKTLLGPYAFWFVVVYLAYASTVLILGHATLGRMLGPVYGGRYAVLPFTTFWFVFVLFAAAVLWQAIARSWWKWPVLACALGASIVCGPWLASTPLAIGSALPAVLFIAAGAGLRRVVLGGFAPYVALAVAIVGVVLLVGGVAAPFDIKSGDWGTPVLSVAVGTGISWGVVALCQIVCADLSTGFASAITGFALCGFTIVLAHPLVLWACSGLPDPVLFFLAVAVPTGIALFARRTPVSQWVTGAPRAAG